MIVDEPLRVFVVSLVALWISARAGMMVATRLRKVGEDVRERYGLILAASLTLLGLIVGFTFSMAVSRYDQRKNLEEAEANAIGTEYLRADLLPAADAAKVRALLRAYLDERVKFYVTHEEEPLQQVNARTAQLQGELWSSLVVPSLAQQTPVMALVVSGMNDVINSQGYTQAAWWNRIPVAAWLLMLAIAVACNLLLGYGVQNFRVEGFLLPILPVILSISFLLIADIDSPRKGMISVHPQNLESLAESLHAGAPAASK
ncbi:MAG TPA: hypothetical protein VLT89_07920 [Usitatibacter sp.]|nr:hypothetical protein [Usitatibacter sp.]